MQPEVVIVLTAIFTVWGVGAVLYVITGDWDDQDKWEE